MTRRRWSVAIAACLLLLATEPARAGGPEPMVAGPEEYATYGSSNGTSMAWFQNTRRHPNNWTAYASDVGDPSSKTKLNEAGTHGFTGGFDPGTNTVIYQQTNGDRSNIFLYDLDSSTGSPLSAVNSEQWEYDPSISNAFVTFVRSGRQEDKLFLYDRSGDTLTKLEAVTFPQATIFNGVVGERYATWTKCTQRTCLAMYYDTQTETTTRVPTANRAVQYAPVIDEANGLIFWVRSGSSCGQNVRIFRATLADIATKTVIEALPDGVDTEWRQFLAPSDTTKGATDLWIGRFRCRIQDMDVYRIADVIPAGRVAAGSGGSSGGGPRPDAAGAPPTRLRS